jgi:hypothetical protein
MGVVAWIGAAAKDALPKNRSGSALRGADGIWASGVKHAVEHRYGHEGINTLPKLLPAALSHAISSQAQRPLALVIVGGMVTSTLLTLLFLPVVFAWSRTTSVSEPSNGKAFQNGQT